MMQQLQMLGVLTPNQHPAHPPQERAQTGATGAERAEDVFVRRGPSGAASAQRDGQGAEAGFVGRG